MAEKQKYKLGELEFDNERDYREAALDLKRIKELMDKYDVSKPEQARRILTSIQAHPETFRSPYGRKFIEKLEKASGRAPVPAQANSTRPAGNVAEKAPKKEIASKREKKPKKQKPVKPTGDQKEKFQIFTVRNFVIGIIIIAGIVAFSLFGPDLFSINNGSADSNSDIKRNMITAYASNQAKLKAQLYTYYFDVIGETEEEAKKDAEEGIGHYVLDLSDRTVSRMTDSEVKETYDQLVDGGDIQNNSFVEPAEITVLKEKLLDAGLSSQSGNGTEGETAVVAAVNGMMKYQQRIFYSLCYDYSLLTYQPEDCESFAQEDMKKMFGDIIYDQNLSEEEKQAYFDSFLKRGLIKDNQVVRFSTDPTAYNLPDLTPTIDVTMKDGNAASYQCSMISYAPAASVFYELHTNKHKGYLCFRNNGGNTEYIELDETTSVTAQGDFFLIDGDDFYTGKWFYNKQDIGLLMNGDHSSKISYVHDLTY